MYIVVLLIFLTKLLSNVVQINIYFFENSADNCVNTSSYSTNPVVKVKIHNFSEYLETQNIEKLCWKKEFYLITPNISLCFSDDCKSNITKIFQVFYIKKLTLTLNLTQSKLFELPFKYERELSIVDNNNDTLAINFTYTPIAQLTLNYKMTLNGKNCDNILTFTNNTIINCSDIVYFTVLDLSSTNEIENKRFLIKAKNYVENYFQMSFSIEYQGLSPNNSSKTLTSDIKFDLNLLNFTINCNDPSHNLPDRSKYYHSKIDYSFFFSLNLSKIKIEILTSPNFEIFKTNDNPGHFSYDSTKGDKITQNQLIQTNNTINFYYPPYTDKFYYCSFTFNIDFISYSLLDQNTSLSLANFYCLVGSEYKLSFDSILNTSIKEQYIYTVISKIEYGNFKINQIKINQTEKNLSWDCQLLYSNLDNVLYPIETPEITLLGTQNQSRLSVELLTFNIKPIVPFHLKYNTLWNAIVVNKSYIYEIEIEKCLGNDCIPYYHNTNFSMESSNKNVFSASIDYSEGNYLHLKVICYQETKKNESISLIIWEKIDGVDMLNLYYNETINVTFTCYNQIIPSFIYNNKELKAYNDKHSFKLNEINNLVYWEINKHFTLFVDKFAKENKNNDTIYPSISDFVYSLNVSNRALNMIIKNDTNSDYYTITCDSIINSNATLILLIQNKELIEVYIPLTVIPYYHISFSNSSHIVSNEYIEQLIPVNINNELISSYDYTIKIIKATKKIDEKIIVNIEDEKSYFIDEHTKVFYFSPNISLDLANSCKKYLIIILL